MRAEKEIAVAALQQQIEVKDAFIADTTSHCEQLEMLLHKSNSEAAAAAARDAATRAEVSLVMGRPASMLGISAHFSFLSSFRVVLRSQLEEKLAQQSKTHRAAVARLQSTLGKLNEALNRSAADRLLQVL